MRHLTSASISPNPFADERRAAYAIRCVHLFDFFPDRQNEIAYYRDTLDLMISAEKLGFDSAWVGEEHFYSIGLCPSPQFFLTALAREITRLRLGTAVSLLPFENPLRKAEDFAMLDLLSGGRLNFGAGRKP